MMADAITFDLGGFPPIEFQLASSEGLAPLPLPQSLPQPSPDAVRLFQAAMERDAGEVARGGAEGEISRGDARGEISRGGAEGEISRRGAETQRVVGGEIPQTGLTGFEKIVDPSAAPRTGEVVTQPAFAPLGVENTPRPENPVNLVNPVQKGLPTGLNTVAGDARVVPQAGEFVSRGVAETPRPENPVNLVNPVQKEVPAEINTVAGDAPIVPQAGDATRGDAEGEVSRGDAETQRPVGGEVFQTGWAGLTGFEKAVEPSAAPRAGEVVTKPDSAPLGVENTIRPENPVNPVQKEVPVQVTQDLRASAPLREINVAAGDAPVAPQAGESVSRGDAEGEVSRGDAETQRTVGGEVFQTGWAGLTGFERTVNPFETPRTGEVVTKPDFAPIGVDQTPRPENPVNPVNPVQKELPTALNPVKEETPVQVTQDLRASASLREINKDIADAPVASAATSRPLREEEISRGEAEAQRAVGVLQAGLTGLEQVNAVAAQSARTEAVVATVARMVETVNQIVEAVAAEIAVSPTLASGNGDIRITLKPTVLDGSEIRLTAQSGELTVSIAPATPAAAALAAAALPRLETALAEHAPSFHHVAVVVATARKGKEK